MKFMKFKNFKNRESIIIIALIIAAIAVFGLAVKQLTVIGGKKATAEMNDAMNKSVKIKITTHDKEFDKMTKMSEQYINSAKTDSSIDNTEKSTETENKFVDNKSSNTEESAESQLYKITDTLYSNDFMLSTYVNSSGDIRSCIAILDKNTDKIAVRATDELSEIETANEYTRSKELKNIGKVLINIIESDSKELNNETTKELFTKDSYNDIVTNINNSIKSENVRVTFMRYNKSSLDSEYFDRIIAQVESLETTRNSKVNIIIKLDENNKIYDMDII